MYMQDLENTLQFIASMAAEAAVPAVVEEMDVLLCLPSSL